MNRYASPEAFKQALEQRLRTAAGGGSPERGRQLLVFDRFLARIARDLRAALEQTFAFRATHPLPATLPAPPDAWRAAYAAIARDDRLQWASLDDVYDAARVFLDPVLITSTTGSWSPLDWRWSSRLP